MSQCDKLSTKTDVDLPISAHQHFKMYKPANVMSQFVFNHRKRKNRKLLGDVVNFTTSLPDEIMAIGRLDEDSEGLLLLTTDGKMSKRVREKDVEKEYWVQVNGRITEEAMEKLRKGVEITLPAGGTGDRRQFDSAGESNRLYHTMPCHAKLLETKIIEVTQNNCNKTQEIPTNKQHKVRKKFKGSCNKCGQTGHKNKDCTIYLMDQRHNKSDRASSSETKLKMSLPSGIPPSNRHTLSEQSPHGPSSWISVTVTEGKYRQVRKMTAAVGFPTLRLVRVRIGLIALDGMVEGEVRRLDESEIESCA